MKKLVIVCLLITGFALSSSLNAEGWDYYSKERLDKMEGRLYVRADCTEFPGDDCTVSGASWRMDIDALQWVAAQLSKRGIKLK